jgi:hypothetical protein
VSPGQRGLLLVVLLALAGCAGVARKFGDGLASGIRNHDDPATVADALPAYLILVDGLLAERGDNAMLLRTGAELYGAYAGSFVDDPARAAKLARRGFDYARRMACVRRDTLCSTLDGPVDEFARAVAAQPPKRLVELHALAGAWTTYIQRHSDDWKAIAALPKAQALVERVVQIAPAHDQGMAQVYLGVLHSLRPAAVGGQPERGRAAFEAALAASNGQNLMAKALFAEYYARLTYDRDLHDRLVEEVLAADAAAPGLTLSNVLAQQRAAHLKETANEFF